MKRLVRALAVPVHEQLFIADNLILSAADLQLVAVVLLVFCHLETVLLAIGCCWVNLAAHRLVGPSFSPRLFLYVRESHLQHHKPPRSLLSIFRGSLLPHLC